MKQNLKRNKIMLHWVDGTHILKEWNGIPSRLSWKTTAIIKIRMPQKRRRWWSHKWVLLTPLTETSIGPQLYSKGAYFQKRKSEWILFFIKEIIKTSVLMSQKILKKNFCYWKEKKGPYEVKGAATLWDLCGGFGGDPPSPKSQSKAQC